MSKAIWVLLVILAASSFPPQPTAIYRAHGEVLLPDPVQTPGVVRTSDKNEICSETTPQFRQTKESTKQHVCMMYGLKAHCYGRQTNEIDHLISLEIGGADDPRNLWPEPYNQHPGAHEKDALENHLHKLICSGEIDVAKAQREIVRDWYQLYLDLKLAPASDKGEEREGLPGELRAAN